MNDLTFSDNEAKESFFVNQIISSWLNVHHVDIRMSPRQF